MACGGSEGTAASYRLGTAPSGDDRPEWSYPCLVDHCHQLASTRFRARASDLGRTEKSLWIWRRPANVAEHIQLCFDEYTQELTRASGDILGCISENVLVIRR